MTLATTDQAVINIPLAKRGNLNAEIDRNLKAQRIAARAAWKASRAAQAADMAQVRQIVAGLSDERLTQLGKVHGLTIRQTRENLLSFARSHPALALKAMMKEAV